MSEIMASNLEESEKQKEIHNLFNYNMETSKST